MQIAEGFLLREIAGTWVVVPIGERLVHLNGILSLNESSSVLWKKLEDGAEIDDLVELLTDHFDVASDVARADVVAFIDELKSQDLLK